MDSFTLDFVHMNTLSAIWRTTLKIFHSNLTMFVIVASIESSSNNYIVLQIYFRVFGTIMNLREIPILKDWLASYWETVIISIDWQVIDKGIVNLVMSIYLCYFQDLILILKLTVWHTRLILLFMVANLNIMDLIISHFDKSQLQKETHYNNNLNYFELI